MLSLPRFEVCVPETVEEVVAALAARPGARLVAGGTDLLPNLKHRLEHPPALVSLHRVRGLSDVVMDDDAGELRIGGGAVLSEVADSEVIRSQFPSLAAAAESVAGPQIRNRATLGGNLNLDTRCRWVNQTQFWRSAIGGCIKSEGDVCHVVSGGKRCVAALSSDCAPVLVSLDASVELANARGTRLVPLSEYYTADGVAHTTRAPDELLVSVRVPRPRGPRRAGYVKWRPRQSIDFPLVSVALRFDLEREDPAAAIAAARVVAGVLGSRPRELRDLDVVGRPLSEVAADVARAAFDQCKPLANVPGDPRHRRHLIRVLTRREVERLAR
jgi:4-hydroxybenzoyl-CoA reductase subunit beta